MKSLASVLAMSVLLIASRALPQEVHSPSEVEAVKIRAEIERAKAEIEKARAEVEKAKAEAEKAKAEAERARLDARRARAELGPEQAEDPANLPGFHRHDGLFIRMTVGPGFGGFNGTGHAIIPMSTQTLTDPDQSGTVFGGSLSVGGTVSENLILHGDLWFCASTSRQRDLAYQDFGTAVVGGGLTYYWMPSNFYVSGSLGLAATAIGLQRSDDPIYAYEYQRESITASGAGIMLSVGKEWWVSPNWALGTAIQLDFSYAEGNDLSIRQGSARALFSATFN